MLYTNCLGNNRFEDNVMTMFDNDNVYSKKRYTRDTYNTKPLIQENIC